MLRNEAAWLGAQLGARTVSALSPLLSIGSGTEASRARQPWINQLVFEPLRARGVEVRHHEHRPAPGVDVTGDLGDPRFLDGLGALGARSILCANVFEHVTDRRSLADALAKALPPGGLLFVTVPRRYPHHPDPIDTMYRPSPDELVALFPTLSCVAADEVECESLLRYALTVRGKRAMVANALRARRAPAAARRPPSDGTAAGRMLLGPTAVTCAVLVGDAG